MVLFFFEITQLQTFGCAYLGILSKILNFNLNYLFNIYKN